MTRSEQTAINESKLVAYEGLWLVEAHGKEIGQYHCKETAAFALDSWRRFRARELSIETLQRVRRRLMLLDAKNFK